MILLFYVILIVAAVCISKKLRGKTSHGLLVLIGYLYFAGILAYLLIKNGSFREAPTLSVAQILYDTVLTSTFGGITELIWETASLSVGTQMTVLALLISAVTAEAVAFALFGRLIRRTLLTIKGRFAKEQYILIGDVENCLLLAEDIKKNEPKAFLVYLTKDHDEEEKHPWLTQSPAYLNKLNSRTSYTALLLDSENSLWMMQKIDNIAEGKKLKVTVLAPNDMIRFEDFKDQNCDAYLVSKEQLLTRNALSLSAPVDLCIRFGLFDRSTGVPLLKKPLRVCILGFEELGKEILLGSYEHSRFLTAGLYPSAQYFVFDRDAEKKQAAFLVDVPYFKEKGEISFVNADLTDFDYFDKLPKNLHQIILASSDHKLNFDTAVKLCRYFRTALVKNPPELLLCLDSSFAENCELFSAYENIRILYTDKTLYSFEALVQREFDKAARERNELHNKNSSTGKPWHLLGTFTQNANRAVVWDEENKRKLMALASTEKDDLALFLAKYEHERWNAFHHTRGWLTLPPEALTEEEKNTFVTKHPREKRHLCLVPWDELDALPQEKPGLLKYYDFQSAQNLVDAYKKETSL